MKRIAIALLATAAAVAAHSARAEGRVRIGIDVGGPVYRPAPPAVVYAPAPVMVVPTRGHGYWQDVQVKTWVPERWVLRHSRWGRHERICEPGYYTVHTDRVWVDGRADRSHHGHDDRGYRGGHDDQGYRGGYDNRGGYSYGQDKNRGHDSRGGWKR